MNECFSYEGNNFEQLLRPKSPVMPETEAQHSDELSPRQISGGYRVAEHIGGRFRLVVMALGLKVREHLGSFPLDGTLILQIVPAQ